MLQLTANKTVAKKICGFHGIPTPPWQRCKDIPGDGFAVKTPWIVKPATTHGSAGIDDDTALCADGTALLAQMKKWPVAHSDDFFIEQYIEGREFNISLLEIDEQPVVLPPAEIVFTDYPVDKPRIVGYRAKWDPDSFEYTHTRRRFTFPATDASLLEELRFWALRCWDVFECSGYIRVDFRVDDKGRPWILEVNGNPCLAPDAGFAAAAAQGGIEYSHCIEYIVIAARTRHLSRNGIGR